MSINPKDLYEWCKIPAEQLADHPDARVRLRVVQDSAEMGQLIAKELVELIETNNAAGRSTRAIIPCGPTCWYAPWTDLVNTQNVSLRNFTVFHMDECLDWEGKLLPKNHPLNFRTYMEKHFYGPIRPELDVPDEQRFWLTPRTMDGVAEAIREAPIDITVGGWGQDGHIAYNQARRNPFSRISLQDLAESTIRIQDNNIDTILALAQRNFGSAWQFVPPMSVTLGVSQCLSAASVRLFSDTGAWKQTALRVALFADPTPQYPMTLLQRHEDAIITATLATACHPISEHPEWELF